MDMTAESSSIHVFNYDTTSFNYTINKNDTKSRLDAILEEKWKYAEENGILRYKLDMKNCKILEGSYGFLAQLNPDRALNRRTPQDICSMSQPFNSEKFNFTKLPAKEIFLDLGDGSGNDVIAANVSPIGWGHFLFLPERFGCFPQRMRESSLLKALELMLLSKSQYLRIVFNGLCANASLNHLHWHLYYLRHQMVLEDIELEELEGPVFALKHFPAKGFCLKLSSFSDRDIRKLASWSFFLINHLQENNVAHNVFITRARENVNSSQVYDDIRIYIWARKSSIGAKNPEGVVLAVCELFGHLTVRTDEDYENISEDQIVKMLDDVTAEVFSSIYQSVKKEIVEKIEEKIKQG